MRYGWFWLTAAVVATASPALAWYPVRQEVRPVVVAPVPVVQIGPVVVGVAPPPERVVVVKRPRRHRHHREVIIVREDDRPAPYHPRHDW